MDPFTNNLKFDQTAGTIVIPLQIPSLEELIREPVALGDHLRRRRMELGLFQKDVATRLGVTASTIWNWEHGWTIRKRFIPRIVAFLGYNPDQNHTIPEANSELIASNCDSIENSPPSSRRITVNKIDMQ